MLGTGPSVLCLFLITYLFDRNLRSWSRALFMIDVARGYRSWHRMCSMYRSCELAAGFQVRYRLIRLDIGIAHLLWLEILVVG